MTRPHRISAGRRVPARGGRAACLLLVAMSPPARGDETPLRLAAPPPARALVAYLLPRFTLKTRAAGGFVGAVDARRPPGPIGRLPASAPWPGRRLVLTGLPARVMTTPTASSIGCGAPVGATPSPAFAARVGGLSPGAGGRAAPTGPLVTGDPVAGEELATRHCGRCHMVNERTRMTTIGATPSFAPLRGLADWRHRFETFYSLNPHPAFTQVAGVTPPFDESRPPPIVPLRLTVAEIDAILAYVAGLAPADLAGR